MDQNNASEIIISLKFETTRLAVISKIIALIVLGGVFGYILSKEAVRDLEQAETISLEKCSKEICIEEVLAYKESLSNDSNKQASKPAYTIPLMTVSASILFGGYELLALIIRLVIKKIITGFSNHS
ncbi:hypothetical protein MC7420_4705 [Coleofasciculus chthonoplastes PCC 7420]|uniref:Uncharacterized protein n=1 Tax=Coleofasciculus chthonoplastes PCC 7420 TaxID=118168 RepID=B4VN54_9CYAN|nr:hypothetical protein [Coleofasciculus chthonoplastes]EDX76449.1 hypothetical protein MC7420_4705 [Coleofasciculus chthonoplastes PCC 7420]